VQYHQKLLLALLLASAACSARPMETVMPRPVEVLLRVTTYATCLEETRCGPRTASTRRGTLMFVDADSLVMFDMRAAKRVTVRPGAGVLVELYRGQRSSASAIVKGVGKGALIGAAVGAGEGLLTVGLGKLLGNVWGLMPVSQVVSTGAIMGVATGVVGGGGQAVQEGEPVWERVTLLQLRQALCHCPNPDLPGLEPTVRLIP
jgi:hypothetical protein